MDYPENRKEKPATQDKKIEQITTGVVTRKKRSLGKRITELFVGGDAKSVWAYIAYDVMIPAAKDMLTDAVSSGVERLLFGDSRAPSRRSRSSVNYNTQPGRISYNRYAPANPSSRFVSGPQQPIRLSQRARSAFNFDEIILATRVEAEEVLERLFDLVERYESVTVADLYGLVGVTGDFTDEKYGWTDLRGAGVTRIPNGYLLDLPRPDLLD